MLSGSPSTSPKLFVAPASPQVAETVAPPSANPTTELAGSGAVIPITPVDEVKIVGVTRLIEFGAPRLARTPRFYTLTGAGLEHLNFDVIGCFDNVPEDQN